MKGEEERRRAAWGRELRENMRGAGEDRDSTLQDFFHEIKNFANEVRKVKKRRKTFGNTCK